MDANVGYVFFDISLQKKSEGYLKLMDKIKG